jgi:uncharacterized protein (TIGR02996 family)
MNVKQMIKSVNLDDHTDRLMLADWMEEQGRAGESLLLRCEGLPLTYWCKPSDHPLIAWDIDANDSHSFFMQYLKCILFTELAPDGNQLERNYSLRDFAPSAVVLAWNDCQRFYLANWGLIKSDPGKAGRNFWWNRNGHGTGFWCNWDDEEVGQTLDTESELAGECFAYVGDDGLIYLQ